MAASGSSPRRRKVNADILHELCRTLERRKQADPAESYTAGLFRSGPDSILQKIGEEATETIIAAKSGDEQALVHEIADLWFHTLVLLKFRGMDAEPVLGELARRFGLSGLAEKARRGD